MAIRFSSFEYYKGYLASSGLGGSSGVFIGMPFVFCLIGKGGDLDFPPQDDGKQSILTPAPFLKIMFSRFGCRSDRINSRRDSHGRAQDSLTGPAAFHDRSAGHSEISQCGPLRVCHGQGRRHCFFVQGRGLDGLKTMCDNLTSKLRAHLISSFE